MGWREMIEIKNGNKVERYQEVAEDFDSFVVKGVDKEIEGGFTYTNAYTNEPSCMVIMKDQVTSHYNDWEDTFDLYKGIRVYCRKDKETGKITIKADNVPDELAGEFTREEYLDDARGENYPPFKNVRFIKTIEADDPDLKLEVTKHYHRDFKVDRYGVVPGMGRSEYDRLHAEYLADRIKDYEGLESDPIYRLFIGSYGFDYLDDKGLVDLDTVFEKIIPAAYQMLLDEGTPYGARNFVDDLERCVFRGEHFPGFHNKEEYTVIRDGRRADLSPEYIYYLYLQRALRVKKYHAEGVVPYSLLELSFVWYSFEENYEEYSNDHNPVEFDGVRLCDDLGEYVKSIRAEMEYYIPFDTLTEK